VQLTFNEVGRAPRLRRQRHRYDALASGTLRPGPVLAMRYGARAPGARHGGLADTVPDLAPPQGNGVVFERYDQLGPLYTALVRAVETVVQPPPRSLAPAATAPAWPPILGWAAPAERYVEIYRWARCHRSEHGNEAAVMTPDRRHGSLAPAGEVTCSSPRPAGRPAQWCAGTPAAACDGAAAASATTAATPAHRPRQLSAATATAPALRPGAHRPKLVHLANTKTWLGCHLRIPGSPSVMAAWTSGAPICRCRRQAR
jgi:hypothetical protein